MNRTKWLAAIVFLFAHITCKKAQTESPGDVEGHASAAKPQEGNSIRDDQPAVVFLGDSITAGSGLETESTYPSLIQQKIDEHGLQLRVINAGRSGDTTAGGLARLDWYLRDNIDLFALVINLGSNDAMRGLSIEQIEKNLVTMVEKVTAKSPKTRVFVFQMETFPNMGPQYADTFRYLFSNVAEKTGATLLPFPLDGIAGVAELNQADGIHPNEKGMQRVADNVWVALRPHLSETAPSQRDSELVEITKVAPGISVDMRYAGTNNFAKKKLYPSTRCLLRKPVAEALARVQKRLEKRDLALKMWDCYRPFSVQEDLWRQVNQVQYVAKPVRDEGGKLSSGSKHSRGAAVDLTLVDSNGKELDMPSDFNDFSARAHRGNSSATSEQLKNAKLLEDVMVNEGFVPLLTEWWHFDGPSWRSYPLSDQPL